jgi:hypothetical protein
MAIFYILLEVWLEKELQHAVKKAVLITIAFMLVLGAALFTFIKLT